MLQLPNSMSGLCVNSLPNHKDCKIFDEFFFEASSHTGVDFAACVLRAVGQVESTQRDTIKV